MEPGGVLAIVPVDSLAKVPVEVIISGDTRFEVIPKPAEPERGRIRV